MHIISQKENSFRNIYVLQTQLVRLTPMEELWSQNLNFYRNPRYLLHFRYKTKLVLALIELLDQGNTDHLQYTSFRMLEYYQHRLQLCNQALFQISKYMELLKFSLKSERVLQ